MGQGSLATTVRHVSHNLTVFVHDPDDMVVAANTLVRTGGGSVVVKAGEVPAHLSLQVAGLVSDAPHETVAGRFCEFRDAAGSIVDWKPPYLVFKALVGATLACDPGPHQADLGIADPVASRILENPLLEDRIPA